MRDLIYRARSVTDDPAVHDAIRHVEQYLNRMQGRVVDVPVGNPFGYGCMTVIALLAGLSGIGSGTAGGALFGLICLAVVALMVVFAWVPRWKANSRVYPRSGAVAR